MKNDYRCGKGGKLRLSAHRKKRKATYLIAWGKKQSTLNSETSESSNATSDNNFEEKLSTALPVNVQQNTNDSNKFELCGRRIVNIANFIKQLQQLNQHGVCGCTLSDMIIISESRKGLNSGIKFKCLMCNLEKTIWTNDVELEAVVGTIGVGMGFSNMEEFFCAMNIPSMSQNTYITEHDLVSDYWEKCASIEMEQAVECERKLAIQREDVDADGVPLLTVVVDGTWAKRSYRTNYTSLSGAAAIVGYYTKKVLYYGVRNKYCATCAVSKRKDASPPDHKCFKNWSGNSSAMEADIIVKGFCESMSMYGVKYAVMIGDGDSNVYKKILDARPYNDITVEKIECRNHLLRNFCNKIKDIARNSKLGNIDFRKIIGNNMMRLRCALVKASKYRKNDNVYKLRQDIMNSPYHVFGNHEKCEKYFCTGAKKHEKDYIPQLKDSGILSKVMDVVDNMACNARSLQFNSNNNSVEEFNSMVAKHIGGKRVNFCLKRSYKTRCSTSVVSHNSRMKYYKIHHQIIDKSPGRFCKQRELRANNKIKAAKLRRKFKVFKEKIFCEAGSYGPHAEKPDLSKEEFDAKRVRFFQEIERSVPEIKELERKTIQQRDSLVWRQEKRRLLTASNFGAVCNKLPSTSCGNIVKRILYNNIDTPDMRYGRLHEKDAIDALQTHAGVNVLACGLFVDKGLNFLGATPDGVVENEDCIVEVKCPSSCENLFPNEAVLQKKFTFWRTDKSKSVITCINKKHSYFFQVQGQLHVTGMKYCLFALWTSKGIKVEKIERDDSFWENEMVKKLTTFYYDCLLPEIIDPRHVRSMSIRDPWYILDAMEKKKSAKNYNQSKVPACNIKDNENLNI